MRSEKMLVCTSKLWFVPPKPFYSIHVNYIYDAKVVEAARKKIEMRKKEKGEKQEKRRRRIYTRTAIRCVLKRRRRDISSAPLENRAAWCNWQKDLTTGSTTYKEERTIPHSFFHELWPHFEALSM